jgi:hypothetical protein
MLDIDNLRVKGIN